MARRFMRVLAAAALSQECLSIHVFDNHMEASMPDNSMSEGSYEWTQMGLDTVSSAGKFEAFASPKMGEKLTAKQILLAGSMGLKVNQMVDEHLVAKAGTVVKSKEQKAKLQVESKRLKDAEEKDETLFQWTEKGASMLKGLGYFEVFGNPHEGDVVSHRQMKLATTGGYDMTQWLSQGHVAGIDATGDAIHNGASVDTAASYTWTPQGVASLKGMGFEDSLKNPMENSAVSRAQLQAAEENGFPLEKLVLDKIVEKAGATQGSPSMMQGNADALHWTEAGVAMAKSSGLYDVLGHPKVNAPLSKQQRESAARSGIPAEQLLGQGVLARG